MLWMNLDLFFCCQWLAAQLDTNNAIKLWLAADRLFLTKMKETCFDHMLAHKQEVLSGEDVDQLPEDARNTIRAHREVHDQVVRPPTNELSLTLSLFHRSSPLVGLTLMETSCTLRPSA